MKSIRLILILAVGLLSAAGCTCLRSTVLPGGDEEERARIETQGLGPIPDGTLVAVEFGW